METKYLHIAIDNEIQKAYNRGFEAGFISAKEVAPVIVKPEPQQVLEDPTEELFSDDLIHKHTREHKSHKTGFKSPKHQWITDHTDTLSSYTGFKFEEVAELFPQFTVCAVRNKLNKLGFRIKQGIIQPSQI